MAGKRKLNARQLRFLFARGVLRGKGSGKDRKVTYNKNASKSRSERIAAGRKIANSPDVARRALKGSGLRVRQSNRPDAANNPLTASGQRMKLKGDTRFLVRTARADGRLKPRSGGSRKVPSKAERDKTRAARIAAGNAKARQYLSKNFTRLANSDKVSLDAFEKVNTRSNQLDRARAARIAAGKLRAQAFANSGEMKAALKAKPRGIRAELTKVAQAHMKPGGKTKRGYRDFLRRLNGKYS